MRKFAFYTLSVVFIVAASLSACQSVTEPFIIVMTILFTIASLMFFVIGKETKD